MPSSLAKLPVIQQQPDCTTFPCHEECCSAGCDVWPHERSALLGAGLAEAKDFTEPYLDDEGDWLYRTMVGRRGCTFLGDERGCRLHHSGLKPSVCVLAPRDAAEADELEEESMLPCRATWHY